MVALSGKDYQKRYYERNKKACIERAKQWKAKHPELYRGYSKNRYQVARKKVYDHYGWVCACCGETNNEFLTIDHIGGGGAEHRKAVGPHLYAWLVRNNFPEGFRTLCYNCNMAIGSYGYCPHEKEREAYKEKA
jgi:hypothetical protein